MHFTMHCNLSRDKLTSLVDLHKWKMKRLLRGNFIAKHKYMNISTLFCFHKILTSFSLRPD